MRLLPLAALRRDREQLGPGELWFEERNRVKNLVALSLWHVLSQEKCKEAGASSWCIHMIITSAWQFGLNVWKKNFDVITNPHYLWSIHAYCRVSKVCSALSSGQVASGRKILFFRFRNRGTYFWFILSACFFHFASDVFSYHKCWPRIFRTHITGIHMYITSYKRTFRPSTIY